MLQDKYESEDIISVDSSTPDMNLEYQHTTTFDNIALPHRTQQPNYNEFF